MDLDQRIKEILISWGHDESEFENLSYLNYLEAFKAANGDYYDAAVDIEDYLFEIQDIKLEDEELDEFN
jgi:hypothetical protein